jgi:hypothetical protein
MGYRTFEITGKRSVIYILNHIINFPTSSQKTKEELTKYRDFLQSSISKIDVLPSRALEEENLTKICKIQTQPPSIHSVYLVEDKKSKQLFYHKKNPANRKIAEWEAAISWYWKLMLGEKVAAARCSYDNQGKRNTNSERIEKFVSFNEMLKQKKLFSVDELVKELVKGGLGGILAVAHILQEDDLHSGNIGFANGLVRKIDHDRSFFSRITHKYTSLHSNEIRENPLNGQIIPSPNQAFPIKSEDIEKLPNFVYAKPYHKPAEWLKRIGINPVTLGKHPGFIRDKYKHYIKSILINEEILKKIAAAHMVSKKSQNEFVKEISQINKEFYKELLSLKEVQQLVNDDKNLLQEIIDEFTQYNQLCDNSHQPDLKFDPAIIQANYEEFAKNCTTKLHNGDLHVNSSNLQEDLEPLIIDLHKVHSNELRNYLKTLIIDLHNLSGKEDQTTFQNYLNDINTFAIKLQSYGYPIQAQDLYNSLSLKNEDIYQGDFERFKMLKKTLEAGGIRDKNNPANVISTLKTLSDMQTVVTKTKEKPHGNLGFATNLVNKIEASRIVDNLTQAINTELKSKTPEVVEFKKTAENVRDKIQNQVEKEINKHMSLEKIKNSSTPTFVNQSAQLIKDATNDQLSKTAKLRKIRQYRYNALQLTGIQKFKVCILTFAGAAAGLVIGAIAGAAVGAAAGAGFGTLTTGGVGTVPAAMLGGGIGAITGIVAGPMAGGFLAYEKSTEYYRRQNAKYADMNAIAGAAESLVVPAKNTLSQLIKIIENAINKYQQLQPNNKKHVTSFFHKNPYTKLINLLTITRDKLSQINLAKNHEDIISEATILIDSRIKSLTTRGFSENPTFKKLQRELDNILKPQLPVGNVPQIGIVANH